MEDLLDYFFFHNEAWECGEGGGLGRIGEASGRAQPFFWVPDIFMVHSSHDLA